MNKIRWLTILGVCIFAAVGVTIGYFLFKNRSDDVGRIELKSEKQPNGLDFTTLLRDGINRGRGYPKPADRAKWGNPRQDFSRLASAYYHRCSPVGVVLHKFDWLSEMPTGKHRHNQYQSDARLPASLIAMNALSVAGNLPFATLTAAWSEPPLGIVGLNAGTMASYARPFQRVHFFERDDQIASLSWPKPAASPHFPFLRDALDRGAHVIRFPGEERETLATKAPEGFYHVLVIETSRTHSNYPSTALLTKEAMQLFMDKLRETGILCYHTSSRLYDLPPLLANSAGELKLACMRGHDAVGGDPNDGFFTSEWVMIARNKDYLRDLREPPGYAAQLRQKGFPQPYWSVPVTTLQPCMTDAQKGALRAYLRQ